MAKERLSIDGHERLLGLLAAGDPTREVWFAWDAKEVVRQIYDHTEVQLAEAWVDEIGRDLPTTRRLAMNDLVNRVKRIAFGFRRIEHYRIRALLYAAKRIGTYSPPSQRAEIRSTGNGHRPGGPGRRFRHWVGDEVLPSPPADITMWTVNAIVPVSDEAMVRRGVLRRPLGWVGRLSSKFDGFCLITVRGVHQARADTGGGGRRCPTTARAGTSARDGSCCACGLTVGGTDVGQQSYKDTGVDIADVGRNAHRDLNNQVGDVDVDETPLADRPTAPVRTCHRGI